jgi:hypothetical protein
MHACSYRKDKIEILLKVAVNTIKKTNKQEHYSGNQTTRLLLIVINIFYKEHAIIVMIMLCMLILGDRFIKAIIACF